MILKIVYICAYNIAKYDVFYFADIDLPLTHKEHDLYKLEILSDSMDENFGLY